MLCASACRAGAQTGTPCEHLLNNARRSRVTRWRPSRPHAAHFRSACMQAVRRMSETTKTQAPMAERGCADKRHVPLWSSRPQLARTNLQSGSKLLAVTCGFQATACLQSTASNIQPKLPHHMETICARWARSPGFARTWIHAKKFQSRR